MPENTRVHRCVDHLKEEGGDGNPYAICQASTGQNFHTGKKIKKKKDLDNGTEISNSSNISSGAGSNRGEAPTEGGPLSESSSFGASKMAIGYGKKHGVAGVQEGPKHSFGGGAGNTESGTSSGQRDYGRPRKKSNPMNLMKNLQAEKKFLQGRWKQLKRMDAKSTDVQFEKSYIVDRFKSLNTEEKKLKSIADKGNKKDSKKVGDFSGSFNATVTKKFMDDFVKARDFLKMLSDDKDLDFEVDSGAKNFYWSFENQLKSYHLGSTLQDNIKTLFGRATDPSGLVGLQKRFLKEADSEVNVTDKKNDPKIAALGQDSDINPVEKKPCLLDHWKKDFPEFPEVRKFSEKVGTEHPSNDRKVASEGQDADHNPVEQGEKLPLRKKDFPEFPEYDEQLKLNEVSKEKNPSHIAAQGQDKKINPIEGPSLVKLLKISADAATFLKSLGHVKALSLDHKATAYAFVKAYESVPVRVKAHYEQMDLSKDPMGQQGPAEFAGDPRQLGSELGESSHKAGFGGGLGLPGEEDELGMGMGGDLGMGGDDLGLEGLGGEDELGGGGLDAALGDELGGAEVGGGLGGDLGGDELGSDLDLGPDLDLGGLGGGDELGGLGGEDELGLGGDLGELPLGLEEEEENAFAGKAYKSLDVLQDQNLKQMEAALKLQTSMNALLARFS